MKEDKDLKHTATEIIEPSDLGSKPDEEAKDTKHSTSDASAPAEQIVTIDHGHGMTWGVIVILVALILGVSAYLLIGKGPESTPADTATSSQQTNDAFSATLEEEVDTIDQQLKQLNDSDLEDAVLTDPGLNN
jgi:uncharacterized protein HemX